MASNPQVCAQDATAAEKVTGFANHLMNVLMAGGPEALPYYLAVIIVLKQSYVFRYLKKAVLPVGVLVVAYRLATGANYSLIELLTQWVQSTIHNGRVKSLVGDVLGLIALAGIVHSAEKVMAALKQLVRQPNLKKYIMNCLFEIIRPLPFVQSMIRSETESKSKDLETDLKAKTIKYNAQYGANTVLPAKGKSSKEILKMMHSLAEAENTKWENGRVTGSVYHGSKSHQAMLNEAFGIYSLANPLHADIWPSGMKYESEIVAMTANLVNGGDTNVVGCTTSGGTESIILGIKAHRDYYRDNHGITEPELVACISAHAAVNKACDMLGIKLIHVPMNPNTFQVDVSAVRRAIGPNTIMMYGSAPSYAQGVIDPIVELGALAQQYRIGLHVDCCLGGFVLPFAKKLGYPVPDFDFGVPGVSSMSVDTHKYGYALKGISVLLFRNTALRQSAYFCYADWAGGMYTTPTIAGSRSTGIIAQCWAGLLALGEEGYLKHVKEIMETVNILTKGIKAIPGLKVLGKSEAMVVCFTGVGDVNVYAVVDEMAKRGGWSLGSHQHPPCAHLCVTVPHVGFEEQFLNDLRASVEAASNNPDAAKHGNASIYGSTALMPTGPVNDILKLYNDIVLKA